MFRSSKVIHRYILLLFWKFGWLSASFHHCFKNFDSKTTSHFDGDTKATWEVETTLHFDGITKAKKEFVLWSRITFDSTSFCLWLRHFCKILTLERRWLETVKQGWLAKLHFNPKHRFSFDLCIRFAKFWRQNKGDLKWWNEVVNWRWNKELAKS